MSDRLILWLKRRAKRRCYSVVTFGDDFLFRRFEPFWRDEYCTTSGKVFNPLPLWRPFNVLLHWWRPAPELREGMHDHPRWSITICLRGRMIERTPWGERILRPGSVVMRSRKYIHEFEVPAAYRGKTWTLFVVGRRKYRQNAYRVNPQ